MVNTLACPFTHSTDSVSCVYQALEREEEIKGMKFSKEKAPGERVSGSKRTEAWVAEHSKESLAGSEVRGILQPLKGKGKLFWRDLRRGLTKWGFPGGSDGTESACNAGDPGLIPGLERSPGWQPTPTFLPGESPWTEEPGGLQSMGSQRVGHD